MNELFKIWLGDMYRREQVRAKEAISNEHIWELGYNGCEPLNPHSENIRALEEYIDLINDRREELTV